MTSLYNEFLSFILLVICAGDIELNPGPKKEILVIIFNCVIGILTGLLLIISRN